MSFAILCYLRKKSLLIVQARNLQLNNTIIFVNQEESFQIIKAIYCSGIICRYL